MKLYRKLILSLLLIVAVGINGSSSAKAQSQVYSSTNQFYEDLAPYGRWLPHREYGQVWSPYVEPGFQPYATRGHWVLTEFGNTWVSDYEWGWAPFHYGRWFFDNFHGWLWIPGNEWGPAWVSWRSDEQYYGWAPLGPAININITIPVNRWCFVPKRYIVSRNIYSYCIPPQRVSYIYRNTTIINNIYINNNRRYISGPYRSDMERHTRQRIAVYPADRYNRPSRTELRDGYARNYRPEYSRPSTRDREYYNHDRRPRYENDRRYPAPYSREGDNRGYNTDRSPSNDNRRNPSRPEESPGKRNGNAYVPQTRTNEQRQGPSRQPNSGGPSVGRPQRGGQNPGVEPAPRGRDMENSRPKTSPRGNNEGTRASGGRPVRG